MRPNDLICGKTYRGPRNLRVGRSRERRLDSIDRKHCPMALFTEMSDPLTKDMLPKGASNRMTLKSFAQWAVSAVDDQS